MKSPNHTISQRFDSNGTAVDIDPHSDTSSENISSTKDLLYSIEDVPPWYSCIFHGFQHYLTMFGATVAQPLILAPALCVGDDNVAKAEILATMFFVSGMVTVLQATLGVRLPIVQGGTFVFLTPIFALMSLPKWQCPVITEESNGTSVTLSPSEHEAIWHSRMNEVQGAIMVASVLQIVIGTSGILGFLLQYIGPLVITPTIALIGLTLFESASGFCEGQWWIAIMTMVLIMLFSQYLRHVDFPLPSYSRDRGFHITFYPLLNLFPVIFAILIAWAVCAILTATDVLPDNPDEWGYLARTDTKSEVLEEASWFRFPYPGQWGTPTVSVTGVIGMMAAVFAGTVESIGDYYAAARLSGAPSPPIHAINRGILVEGLGCLMAGLWGTGTGTTSYSENIGALGITKVGSRRVVQVGGLIMVVFGMLSKFGALFVTIPDPIIGGVFMVMFGMITAVGLSNLQYVDLNSTRNLFVFGFSIFFGLSLPQWILINSDTIDTGSDVVDQVFTVLLSTGMFVGGATAFILDNTIPGTDEERGIKQWKEDLVNANTSKESSTCYDFPVGMSWVHKNSLTRFIPICPTFQGWCSSNTGYGQETEVVHVKSEDKLDQPVAIAADVVLNGNSLE